MERKKEDAMRKPIYMLNYKVSNCLVDVRVNDMQALLMEAMGDSEDDVTVNHLIPESGPQEIAFRVVPMLLKAKPGDKFEFEATLSRYVIDEENHLRVSKMEDLLHYKLNEFSSKPKQQFTAMVPYKNRSFKDFETLEVDDRTKQMVRDAYLKLKQQLDEGDYDSFLETLAQRDEEMNQCLYWEMTEQDKARRVIELAAKLQEGYSLAMPGSTDVLTQYGHGKMLRYVRTDLTSALVLRKGSEEYKIDVYLHKEPNSDVLTLI